MPKHNVYLELPKQELSNVDAIFHINLNGEKLGTIKLSKGSLDYYPKHRKKNPISINWTQFDELMKDFDQK